MLIMRHANDAMKPAVNAGPTKITANAPYLVQLLRLSLVERSFTVVSGAIQLVNRLRAQENSYLLEIIARLDSSLTAETRSAIRSIEIWYSST